MQAKKIKMIQMNAKALTGRQISAARALLGMNQGALAELASISVPTLKRMEASTGAAQAMANNVAAVRSALEKAGVRFISENGGGAGVRLQRKTPGSLERE